MDDSDGAPRLKNGDLIYLEAQVGEDASDAIAFLKSSTFGDNEALEAEKPGADGGHGADLKNPKNWPSKFRVGCVYRVDFPESSSTAKGVPILYGQVIQLVHQTSGRFVTADARDGSVKLTNAHHDPTAKRGETTSLFKMKPRYKVRSEGEYIQYDDLVTFEFFTQSKDRYIMSNSAIAIEGKQGSIKVEFNSIESDSSKRNHAWRLRSYLGDVKESTLYGTLKGGDAVRFKHKEFPVALGGATNRETPESEDTYTPCVLDSAEGTDDTNTLWQVELAMPKKGEPIKWKEAVRFKHLGTDKFLELFGSSDDVETKDTSKFGIPVNLNLNLGRFNVLGGDDDDDDEPRSHSERQWRLTSDRSDDCIFQLHPTGHTNSEYVKDYSNARIMHVQSGQWVHIVSDSAGGWALRGRPKVHDRDAFSVIPFQPDDMRSFYLMTSFKQSLVNIATRLKENTSSTRVPFNHNAISTANRALANILSRIVTVGELPTNDDEYYATLIDSMGEVNREHQRILGEQNIIPLIFDILWGMMDDEGDESDKRYRPSDIKSKPTFAAMNRCVKLCYRILMHASRGNSANAAKVWMYNKFLFNQLGYGFFVSDVLFHVFKDNTPLVAAIESGDENIATADASTNENAAGRFVGEVVKKFAEKNEPRLLHLLASLCRTKETNNPNFQRAVVGKLLLKPKERGALPRFNNAALESNPTFPVRITLPDETQEKDLENFVKNGMEAALGGGGRDAKALELFNQTLNLMAALTDGRVEVDIFKAVTRVVSVTHITSCLMNKGMPARVRTLYAKLFKNAVVDGKLITDATDGTIRDWTDPDESKVYTQEAVLAKVQGRYLSALERLHQKSDADPIKIEFLEPLKKVVGACMSWFKFNYAHEVYPVDNLTKFETDRNKYFETVFKNSKYKEVFPALQTVRKWDLPPAKTTKACRLAVPADLVTTKGDADLMVRFNNNKEEHTLTLELLKLMQTMIKFNIFSAFELLQLESNLIYTLHYSFPDNDSLFQKTERNNIIIQAKVLICDVLSLIAEIRTELRVDLLLAEFYMAETLKENTNWIQVDDNNLEHFFSWFSDYYTNRTRKPSYQVPELVSAAQKTFVKSNVGPLDVRIHAMIPFRGITYRKWLHNLDETYFERMFRNKLMDLLLYDSQQIRVKTLGLLAEKFNERASLGSRVMKLSLAAEKDEIRLQQQYARFERTVLNSETAILDKGQAAKDMDTLSRLLTKLAETDVLTKANLKEIDILHSFDVHSIPLNLLKHHYSTFESEDPIWCDVYACLSMLCQLGELQDTPNFRNVMATKLTQDANWMDSVAGHLKYLHDDARRIEILRFCYWFFVDNDMRKKEAGRPARTKLLKTICGLVMCPSTTVKHWKGRLLEKKELDLTEPKAKLKEEMETTNSSLHWIVYLTQTYAIRVLKALVADSPTMCFELTLQDYLFVTPDEFCRFALEKGGQCEDMPGFDRVSIGIRSMTQRMAQTKGGKRKSKDEGGDLNSHPITKLKDTNKDILALRDHWENYFDSNKVSTSSSLEKLRFTLPRGTVGSAPVDLWTRVALDDYRRTGLFAAIQRKEMYNKRDQKNRMEYVNKTSVEFGKLWNSKEGTYKDDAPSDYYSHILTVDRYTLASASTTAGGHFKDVSVLDVNKLKDTIVIPSQVMVPITSKDQQVVGWTPLAIYTAHIAMMEFLGILHRNSDENTRNTNTAGLKIVKSWGKADKLLTYYIADTQAAADDEKSKSQEIRFAHDRFARSIFLRAFVDIYMSSDANALSSLKAEDQEKLLRAAKFDAVKKQKAEKAEKDKEEGGAAAAAKKIPQLLVFSGLSALVSKLVTSSNARLEEGGEEAHEPQAQQEGSTTTAEKVGEIVDGYIKRVIKAGPNLNSLNGHWWKRALADTRAAMETIEVMDKTYAHKAAIAKSLVPSTNVSGTKFHSSGMHPLKIKVFRLSGKIVYFADVHEHGGLSNLFNGYLSDLVRDNLKLTGNTGGTVVVQPITTKVLRLLFPNWLRERMVSFEKFFSFVPRYYRKVTKTINPFRHISIGDESDEDNVVDDLEEKHLDVELGEEALYDLYLRFFPTLRVSTSLGKDWCRVSGNPSSLKALEELLQARVTPIKCEPYPPVESEVARSSKHTLSQRILRWLLSGNQTDEEVNVTRWKRYFESLVQYLREAVESDNPSLVTAQYLGVLASLTGQTADGEIKTDVDSQNVLKDFDVTTLVVKMCSKPYNASETVEQKQLLGQGVRLGMALLKGGNYAVQMRFIRDFHTGAGRSFMPALRDRFRAFAEHMKKRQVQTTVSTEEIEEERLDGSLLSRFIAFLQLLCEGHNSELQLFIRAQSSTAESVNMVTETLTLLSATQNYIHFLSERDPSSEAFYPLLNLVLCGFTALSEYMQGPCVENQLVVVSNGGGSVFNAFLHTLYGADQKLSEGQDIVTVGEFSRFSGITSSLRQNNETFVLERTKQFEWISRKVERAMVVMMMSIMEGHANPDIVSAIGATIRSDVMVSILNYRWQRSLVEWNKKGDDREGDENLSLAFGYYSLMKSVIDVQLLLLQESRISPQLVKKWRAPMDAWEAQPTSQDMKRRLGRVEIFRNKEVERVYYIIPEFCLEQYRKPAVEKWKEEFLREVNRDTAQTKVQGFLDQHDHFLRVMKHERDLDIGRPEAGFTTLILYLLAILTPFFRSVGNFVGLALNFMVIWAMNGRFFQVKLEEIALEELDVVNARLESVDSLTESDRWKAQAIFFGGLLLTLCRFFAMVGHIVSWYDIYKSIGQENFEELYIYGRKWSDFRVLAPFAWIRRKVHGVIHGLFHGDIFYEISLVGMSVLGFQLHPFFFAYQVFAALNAVALVRAVRSAVTDNLGQLGATLSLASVIIYTYTLVGFYFFRGEYDFADAEAPCETLVQCLMTHLDYGFRSPPVWPDDSENQTSHFLINVSYNMIVILILVAIVSGIIIDSFGAKRDKTREIKDNTTNICFICDLPREQFDRFSSGFEDHIKGEHNMWQYAFFIESLDIKQKEDHTGQEGYVYQQVQNAELSFFPIGKALALRGISAEDEIEEVVGQITHLNKKVDDMMAAFSNKLDRFQVNMTRAIASTSK